PISTAYPPITLIVSVHNGVAASVINTANVSGGGDVSPGNNSASDPTNIVLAPTNLVATATSMSEVILNWDSFNNADNYQIERSSNHNPFTVFGTQPFNFSEDSTVSANTTYLYRVRAIVSGYVGLASNVDIATTIVFNETIVPQITTIKAAHITELRTAVNAVRAAAGLGVASFTDDPLPGVFVKA